MHIDTPGAKVDIDLGNREGEGLRLPNVDVNVNRGPDGGVDVNVQRRDGSN